MAIDLLKDLKYSLLDKEDVFIALDRLTRFKNPEIKYKRVFFDIILKHLSQPSISKHKLEQLEPTVISGIVKEVWNNSVKSIYNNFSSGFSLKDLDIIQFDINDEYTLTLMNTDILIPVIESEADNIPKNLKFLSLLQKIYKKHDNLDILSTELREQEKTLFPIKKLILTEGITEEILLPKFAKVSGYDFDKNGIHILATGGKSKVLSIYCEMKYILKIPMFVLLDNDAEPVFNDINSVIREQDKAYLIKAGEFEDILDKSLIVKAFSEMNYDVKPTNIEELNEEECTCKSLENIWRVRKLGEFRKAHLAKAVRECIVNKDSITEEIKTIINIISAL